MLIIWFVRGSEAGATVIGGTLLNMAVAGAMLAYFMQGMSYIVLKKKFPHLARPYKSPFGIAGADGSEDSPAPRSPLRVRRENVIFRIHDRMAREPALGVHSLRRHVR